MCYNCVTFSAVFMDTAEKQTLKKKQKKKIPDLSITTVVIILIVCYGKVPLSAKSYTENKLRVQM